ncbi:hypothetical protein PR048_018834 [Dryococelus australis]|uniref:Uncharacterized protein n=1 Tax=Dryococelus australis TaxID=614101 RepID=A0ABQ9H1X1_9NEOP|nr:hypothetical protein PR048_018834 [Dryococelus australis]
MSGRLVPLLACEDGVVRVLDRSQEAHCVRLQTAPSVLHLYGNDGGDAGDQLLYGTTDGSVGLLKVGYLGDGKMLGYQLSSERSACGLVGERTSWTEDPVKCGRQQSPSQSVPQKYLGKASSRLAGTPSGKFIYSGGNGLADLVGANALSSVFLVVVLYRTCAPGMSFGYCGQLKNQMKTGRSWIGPQEDCGCVVESLGPTCAEESYVNNGRFCQAHCIIFSLTTGFLHASFASVIFDCHPFGYKPGGVTAPISWTGVTNKWLLRGDQQCAGVTCLYCYDLTGDGTLDLLVGRQDGSIEVYPLDDSGEEEALGESRFTHTCSESITSIQGGVVGSPGCDEIVAATYTGWIFGLTTELVDKQVALDADGKTVMSHDLRLKLQQLRAEVDEIEQKVAKEREKYQDSTLDKYDGVSAIPYISVNDKMMLLKEEACYVLLLEVETPIDNVLIQSEVPVELLDVEKNSAVVSFSECDPAILEAGQLRAAASCLLQDYSGGRMPAGCRQCLFTSGTKVGNTLCAQLPFFGAPRYSSGHFVTSVAPGGSWLGFFTIVCPTESSSGNSVLATYRCQANTTRLELKVRTVEGQHGALRAYITPLVQPKCCQLRLYHVRPLSLHARCHAIDPSRGQADTLFPSLAETAVHKGIQASRCPETHTGVWPCPSLPNIGDAFLPNGGRSGETSEHQAN